MDDKDLPMLEAAMADIWDTATRMGLDPFATHFEIVPPEILYEFGAYLLPGRFSHWTHGKAYYQMKTSYDYGLSKIYELVINADPSYAFLLDSNTLLQNKFVIAHVLGHTDFFKHNIWFAHTNRKMLDSVSLSAQRIREHGFEQGDETVEKFLDAALSISLHVDGYTEQRQAVAVRRKVEKPAAAKSKLSYLTDGAFSDLFPPTPAQAKGKGKHETKPLPPEPHEDLLLFLTQHAPDMEEWQRDILTVVREESIYFLPQMQTKIMNEGWASFWHNRIMRDLSLTDEEFTDFARLHASVCVPGRGKFNPYHLGLKMFEDIEERFGREKIFEVREIENDVSFLRNYLTEDLVRDMDLFVYGLKEGDWTVLETEWEKVRAAMCNQLSHHGVPHIVVLDGDHGGKRQLYLKHQHNGLDLDVPYAEKTLAYVEQIWGRPVHLETVRGKDRILFTAEDGNVSHLRLGAV